jgi:hypothetical protein
MFVTLLAVYTIKYAIQAITAHPTAAAIILFSLRCARFCLRRCLSMMSASFGRNDDSIRGAVATASTLL